MSILEPCYIRLHYGEHKILMIEKPQKQQIVCSHCPKRWSSVEDESWNPKISFHWQEGLWQALHPQLSHVLCLTSVKHNLHTSAQLIQVCSMKREREREREYYLCQERACHLIIDQVVECDDTSDERRKIYYQHHIVCFNCTKGKQRFKEKIKRKTICTDYPHVPA